MDVTDATDLPVPPRTAGSPVPLAPTQLYIWNRMLARGTRASSLRMIVTSVRILGTLDTSLLRDCMDFVVARHESLRTTIDCIDGAHRQLIHAAGHCPLEFVDLSTPPIGDAEQDAKTLAQNFADAKVDLSTGPLCAALLIKRSEHEHVLMLGIDHIISDAASCQILNQEIFTLYRQAAQGGSLSLPALPIQFADYSSWLERTYATWQRDHESYWRKRLAGAPHTELARDFDVGATPSVATLHYPFGKIPSATLRDLATRERARLPTVVLAVYIAMLARWFKQNDLVLTFVTHGRHLHPEFRNMVGFLATHLYLRIETTESDSFLDILRRADQEIRSGYQHYDFGRVPCLIPECFTDLGFNWLTTDWTASSLPNEPAGAIKLQPFPVRTAWPVTFNLFFYDTRSGIGVTLAYRTDLFSKSTVDRFGRSLRKFAAECGRAPQQSIAAITMPL